MWCEIGYSIRLNEGQTLTNSNRFDWEKYMKDGEKGWKIRAEKESFSEVEQSFSFFMKFYECKQFMY